MMILELLRERVQEHAFFGEKPGKSRSDGK